ncbi:carbohydrate esterase family 16 protein [Piloderma croceum F 1598]|uniref:Carbohydrate esterase family 16 protein n=1 Tax=Piloderma croceum (strain F 1598) TaxID=765440 RepID=A0A0C3GEB9_PILCF|nr:carbohydrate esterase family 16 protein [Piloderma croceum F 1598]
MRPVEAPVRPPTFRSEDDAACASDDMLVSPRNFAHMRVLFQLALALACPAIILPASCEYYRPRRASPKTTLKDIIVFGDSFADNGNAYRFDNETWPADPHYYHGRFSNGPVWVEDLAGILGVKLHDYAVGGATSDNKLVQGYTGSNSSIAVPSATDQVSQYLGDAISKENKAGALFIIAIGANDAFFDVNVTAAETVGNIVRMMKKLRYHGAKHFLLASYPDLSRLPLRAYSSPAVIQQLHTYSTELRALLQALTGTNVAFADFYQLIEGVLANPDRYGYDKTKVTKSCLTGVYHEAPKSLCDDPDRYIFWDEYHPTRKTHQLLAVTAEKDIQRFSS